MPTGLDAAMHNNKGNATLNVKDLGAETTSRVEQKPVKRIRITFIESTTDSLKNTAVDLDVVYFDSITIGRAPDNIVVIPDITVSRRHAVISRDSSGSIVLVDLNSKNGTYVYNNGVFERVNKVELKDGIVIRLGIYTIIRINLIQG
ncbi:FHA domain containing protein [Caldivirga maquilingensis IC-167]|uniref:FHA domain containing protein n=2 Tax=Caldivirga maquilingensis TaxID=76887 RepID=A8MDV2_CALMQ|nr:FHA domain containing protein [Caldivirga maquilingensis IC-167]